MKPDDRIRDKCYHPTGTFVEFKKEEIEQSITERFERIVRLHPARLAIKTDEYAFTYDQLNKAANRIAHAILALQGREQQTVGLLLDQGADMIVTMLGALKAGKIYVPLDPSYPTLRIAFMMEDARAGLMVSNNRNVPVPGGLARPGCRVLNIDDLGSNLSDKNAGLSLRPETTAYIMYTSGSTGEPKGVVQNHRNVLQKVMTHTNDFHFSTDDRLSFLYSCSFSASVRNIFGALLNGAALYPFNVKEEGLASLARWIVREKITIYLSVPSLFRGLVDSLNEREKIADIRLIYLGGEPVIKKDVESYKEHFSADCILVNSMASNETGTTRQYFMDKATLIKGTNVPVGYEVVDKTILLFDDDEKEIECGGVGEIAVKSRYLSTGYWRKPGLTRTKFLQDPGGGDEMIYLTGDMGRMASDGCLFHLGRKDAQVKIRGYRIEIGDVRTALLEHDGVKDAAVVAGKDHLAESQLVAYFVPTGQPAPSMSELRNFMKKKIPDYMIPAVFVMLDKMPLLPNSKVDVLALRAPTKARPELDVSFAGPATALEAELAGIWAEVLSLDQVGINDNFFDLGGHSLAAARIVSRIIKTFRLKLPVKALFDSPSVAEMAAVIAAHQDKTLNSAELQSMLNEMESLSEEEAKGLLNKIRSPQPKN